MARRKYPTNKREEEENKEPEAKRSSYDPDKPARRSTTAGGGSAGDRGPSRAPEYKPTEAAEKEGLQGKSYSYNGSGKVQNRSFNGGYNPFTESPRQTEYWRTKATNAKYGPNGDQSGLVYAQKAMRDKYGEEGLDEYLQRLRSNQQTKATQKHPREEIQAEKKYRRWLDKADERAEQESNANTYMTQKYPRAEIQAEKQYRRNQERYEQALGRAVEASQPGTAAWKQKTQDARNSRLGDRSQDVYAEKMRHDTASNRPEDWQQLQRDLQYGNRAGITDPGYAYAMKQQGVAASRAAEGLQQQAAAVQGYERMLRKQQAAYDALGFEGYKRTEGKPGEMSVNRFNQAEQNVAAHRLQGMYDKGNDPALVSDKGLPGWIDRYEGESKKRKQQADAMVSAYNEQRPANAWGEVVDYLDRLDEQKGIISDDREQQKASIMDMADVYFRSDFNRDYFLMGAPQEEMREAMFNSIMHDPRAYADRTAEMAPEEKEELDGLIDRVIDRAMNDNPGRWEDQEEEYNRLLKEANAYGIMAEKGRTELGNRTKVNTMTAEAGKLDYSASYDPSLIPAPRMAEVMGHRGTLHMAPEGTEIEKIYFWMNNKPAEGDAGNSRDYVTRYYFATPEQTAAFNKWFKFDQEHGTQAAKAYIDALDGYLNAAMSKYKDFGYRTDAEDPVKAIPLRVATPVLKMAGGLTSTIGAGLAALGVEEAANPTSPLYDMTNMVDTTREHQNDIAAKYLSKIGLSEDVTKLALGVVDSIADNVFAMAAGTALAGANTALTAEQTRERAAKVVQLIMSGEATASSMVQKLEAGMDPTEAALSAIGDGIIEWVTEKWSIEEILKPDVREMLGNKKALAKFLAKTTAAEGSEEIASDILNMGLDSILSMFYNHEDELTAKYDELVANGMEHRAALQKVMQDKLGEIGLSGLAGALSGFAMGGSRVVANTFSQYASGKSISGVQSGTESSGLSQMLDYADKLGEGSQSAEMAAQIRQEMDAGKTPGAVETGRLAQNIQMEAQENLQKIAEKHEGETAIPEEAKPYLEALEGTAQLSRGLNPQEIKASENEQAGDLNWASGEEIEEAEGDRIEGNREAIVYDQDSGKGTIGQITGMSVETGKAGAKLMLTMEVNGEERTVPAAEVKTTDYRASQIIHQAAMNPEFYSSRFTSTLLDAAQKDQIKEKDLGQTMKDAVFTRLFAYAGINPENIPTTKLDAALKEQIWMDSTEEHGQNRKAQVAQANRKQTGTARFNGAEYGTAAWNREVGKANLDPETKNWMDTIAGIAQRAGIEADFKGLADSGVYGWENKSGIGLNIGGREFARDKNGKVVETGKHHMLVTFGHEMTHWLQRNSMQGYNRLEQYVLQSMIEDQGAEAVMKKIDGHMFGEDHLSLEDSISEIVAESCDQILMDESVRDKIAKTDSKLFGQIKHFVQDLVDRFKKAVIGMEESASPAARAMAGRMNDIAKLWLGAYDESISGVANQTNQDENIAETNRLSVARMPDGQRYVVIDTDQDIFDGHDESEFPSIAQKYIKKHFTGTVIGDEKQKAYVDGNSAGHFAYPARTRGKELAGILPLKYRSSTELDNMMKTGEYFDNSGYDDDHPEFPYGFDLYNVTLAFGDVNSNNVKMFSGVLNIGIDNQKRKHFYDMTKLKNVDPARWVKLHNEAAAQRTDQHPDINISDNNEKGNTRKSKARLADNNIEETKDLVAYHNLGPDQLMAVLRLGGFAMPSIGITKTDYINDRYGDISVLFYKDTIDPKASRANKVYGVDAWTPVYPSVEYKVNEKKANAILKKINSIVPENQQIDRVNLYKENLTKDINNARGDIVQAVKRHDILKQAYLADRGIKYETPMREKRLGRGTKLDNAEIVRLVEVLGEDTIREAYGSGYEWEQNHPEIQQTIIDTLNEFKKQELMDRVGDPEKAEKMFNMLKYTEDKWGYGRTDEVLNAAMQYINNGIEQEADEYALRDVLNQKIQENEADYEKWLAEEFDGIIEKKGLRNNKDYYTYSGNPRSWEQMHDEETLENVVRIMKEQDAKGANSFFNQSEILALGTKDFRSVDEIRKDKGRLKHISEEEMSAAKTDIVNRFGELVDELSSVKDGNLFEVMTARDKVRDAIVDALRTSRTEQGIIRVMREWQYNLTQEQAKEIMDLTKEIGELPTEYFEAKPQRGVGLDEIAVVLVPEGTNQELLNAMDREGIQWETYDGTSEDRLKKMNSHEDVRFSRWTEEAMDANLWMNDVTASGVQTEDERILIQAYKGLRLKMDLSNKKIVDYQDKIRRLQERQQQVIDGRQVTLNADERAELVSLKQKLEAEEKKHAKLEDEMLQVTGEEGYARAMYQHNMIYKDYIQGKTHEQVRQTVEDMLAQVKKAQAQMAKDTEDLRKLAQAQAVKTMRSYLGKSSLGEMSSLLRKNYNSAMQKSEIEARLAEMALRLANGEDVSSESEALARDLVDRARFVKNDTLSYLQGVVLNIGESTLDEYIAERGTKGEIKQSRNDTEESIQKKARRLALKQIREEIRGSGVRIIAEGNSRLSEQWDELRGQDMSLPDISSMSQGEGLSEVLGFISGNMESSRQQATQGIDMDEAALFVQSMAANVTTYITGDAKARAQINSLMKQIQELSGRTEETAARMEELNRQMEEVVLAGEKAKGWTTVLQRDVNEAIKYYNKTARVAAETERTKVRKALIEQLRSENTKKLLQQQAKYEEMMRNDRKARELAEDNRALRRQINTVAARIGGRLFGETDQKNIPEEAKPLARSLLGMLLNHDEIYRHVLNMSKSARTDAMARLKKMAALSGEFDPDADLDFLTIRNGEDTDTTVKDKVWQDLVNIETGLMEYRNAEGQGRISLMDRKAALQKIQQAVSEIWTVMERRSAAFIAGQKYEVATLAEKMENEMAGSRFKGERTGKLGRAANFAVSAVGYGNLTPEYFFKNIRNGVLSLLHRGFQDAEQRAGLEAVKARDKVAQIAQETGYNTWDGEEKHEVKVAGGKTVEMTTEQIMALYATWLRESNQVRPEDTAHLLNGGFVLADKRNDAGLYGREKNDKRPIRMTKDNLAALGGYLTEQQRNYVEQIVAYMSGELAELGNETSMQTYGIKKFTEQFYFPIKSWGGVLNQRSDAAIVNKNDNRAMRQSFSKRVRANARNAIEIGDFTGTAMNHIVGMITYNTVGPAVENMNRVLNQQLTYGEVKYGEDGEIDEDDTYKKNGWSAFEDAYGANARKYLERFMADVNGGMTRQADKSLQERLLSVFRKGAVAGSLSVAAQQPLSYIRAATMISPKYLAQALSPTQWSKIHDEMLKYSGIAAIKDMGRFDMNQGQSMIDYITPEGQISRGRKAAQTAVGLTTILPEKMDALTWGRMWVACKLETAARNPGMDQSSDAFLQKTAERFNDIMRKTQVYDSMMVKSQNMRSKNYGIKAITSFMAEPTLTLNVLADAVQNFKEKGGKTAMGKAAATFLLSAALQAMVKAAMSSGRSPDKKRRWDEQFLTKWATLFMSEADPLTLVPGYSDIVELLKNGELADDAWSVIGKLRNVWETGIKWATGKNDNAYRNFEDTVGQIAQLFTEVPLKNLMRDARAIYNWVNPKTYAVREKSNAVIKYSVINNFFDADNLIGVMNTYLKDANAGYGTSTKDYYQRIYDAEKAGDSQAAADMKEYVTLTSKSEDPEKAMNDALRKMAKTDDSMSAEEKAEYVAQTSTETGANNYVIDQVKKGEITAEAARKQLQKIHPDKAADDIWWQVDRAQYQHETGQKVSPSAYYYRLDDALSANRAEDIRKVVNDMLKHGIDAKKIADRAGSWGKQDYLAADENGKRRIRDAIQKMYKALGLTAEDADKVINKWKPKKTK